MSGMSGDELLAYTGGILLRPVSRTISGFSIDSRTLKPGNVFFALRGTTVNGHDFLSAADAKGAACLVIDENTDIEGIDAGVVKVADTVKALQDAARLKRQKTDCRVVGVTGSAGKTTTKEILTIMLGEQFKVCSSKGNFNNELGLPLTILNAEDCQVMVLEMAMRGKGQIKELCEIASPDFGIITNVGKSHLESLGTEEDIARAKGELAEYLGEDATLVLNAENTWTDLISTLTKAKILKFGFSEDSDFKIGAFKQDHKGMEFELRWPGEEILIKTDVPGKHIALNIASAASIAFSLGVKPDIIGKTVASLTGELSRQSVINKGNITIINDTYNANPDSMSKALQLLVLHNGKRKIAVLGSMAELGADSLKYHFELGIEVAGSNIDVLVTVGDPAFYIFKGANSHGYDKLHEHYDSADLASLQIGGLVKENDVVLVKGSRFMQMEQIVRKLAGSNA